MDTGRRVGIDLVRLLGAVAIITGHVWYSPDVPHLLTYSWHVPIFFILSGYLWQDTRSLGDDLARRWGSIVVPYVLWWVVVAVVYVVWATAKGYGPGSIAYYLVLAGWGGALAFRPFTAFWFFTAFLTAVLFVRAVRPWSPVAVWAGALLAITACHLARGAAVHSPLAVVQGLACVVFILVGIGLRDLRPRLPWPGIAGLGLLVIAAGLMALPVYEPLEIKSADLGVPGLSLAVAALIGVALILLAETFSQYVGARVAAVVRTLALGATVMMLTHGLPMLILGTPRSGGWVDYAVVLAVSVVLALATQRTRWAGWMTGAHRSPRVP